MDIKISELTGAVLDALVAECLGIPVTKTRYGYLLFDSDAYSEFRNDHDATFQMFHPSTNWSQAGVIIEREGIELLCESLGFRWVATPQKGPEWRGPTPLIAAMRCCVGSKLGQEVDVPDELLQGESNGTT